MLTILAYFLRLAAFSRVPGRARPQARAVEAIWRRSALSSWPPGPHQRRGAAEGLACEARPRIAFGMEGCRTQFLARRPRAPWRADGVTLQTRARRARTCCRGRDSWPMELLERFFGSACSLEVQLLRRQPT